MTINKLGRSFPILFFVVLLAPSRVEAQGGDVASRMRARDQAQRMIEAFVAGDLKIYAHYTYPPVLKLSGGEEGYIRQTKDFIETQKNQGLFITGASIGDASIILKSGAGWECTLPEQTMIQRKEGKYISQSTLIAVSVDGGKNWTFLDTSNHSLAEMRKALPELNPGLVVKPPQPAVRYAN